jgi:hypothetical protein
MENMNEQAGMTSSGRMWHWMCCVMPIVSCLMWVAGVVFVVLSWISVMNATGEIWGLGPQWYIWNAVMFGILAIYGGGKKMGHHGMCECKGGACVCK